MLSDAIPWFSLRHPNVLPLLGVLDQFHPPPDGSIGLDPVEELGFITPWMPLGNLASFLKDHKPFSPLEMVWAPLQIILNLSSLINLECKD